jgi:hypothetical protein
LSRPVALFILTLSFGSLISNATTKYVAAAPDARQIQKTF